MSETTDERLRSVAYEKISKLLDEKSTPLEKLEEIKVDIELIKEIKKQCESEIVAILNMFEQQAGLIVERIGIDREFVGIGFPSEKTVKIDARLPG